MRYYWYIYVNIYYIYILYYILYIYMYIIYIIFILYLCIRKPLAYLTEPCTLAVGDLSQSAKHICSWSCHSGGQMEDVESSRSKGISGNFSIIPQNMERTVKACSMPHVQEYNWILWLSFCSAHWWIKQRIHNQLEHQILESDYDHYNWDQYKLDVTNPHVVSKHIRFVIGAGSDKVNTNLNSRKRCVK